MDLRAMSDICSVSGHSKQEETDNNEKEDGNDHCEPNHPSHDSVSFDFLVSMQLSSLSTISISVMMFVLCAFSLWSTQLLPPA
jgi:hypothetical protein